MAEDLLLRSDADGIATLTLNAPQSLNVLSDAMLAALQAQIDTLAEDRTTRVVVLRGAGRAFCAGHDLKEMTAARQSEDGGAAAFKDLFDRCARMMMGLQALPQPVIAQVHGIATAAGCQLVATADMAVAAEGARFGVNGVNIGLFCSTPMVALSRNIPRKQAFELLTTGEMIEAQKAQALGLVNRVVPTEDLEAETNALATKVAEKRGAVVAIGKRAFYEQSQMSLADAYAFTGNVMVKNMALRDTEEGIAAFLDKRPPNWSDG
ncbi:putative enoyl-CoA hydratase [Dinoroseobacter shibae DFL 12 = DSM 16493]|jgi:enoyl-CoA hydratase/carnithine racemase|uniref:Enoyl-CoA hydratase domain-containing protein 3, mitochondrial n=1 Tax=Dinoroseobacter shibae (strain DSM 16493 / NCIMB 14021 / DFL 12) TaxID=398580 RepID=A8LKY2_DINSH|nr:enoyl-CoA hydratase [Dinoroseobacter shibae]ABV93346.1 putative enoyl-CoA hydratase [Dinoroseobacter shibae DFL 12 = DSM 16493]URF48262.1 enoyl-CoA hydratase [Dinoroseobacter shibae]URF52572.1 enoyl-CoA hydratase [Dinoroseobacter shibae]